MNRTDQITAIQQRIDDGCLGDAEYCELQHPLLTLEPEAIYIAADGESGVEPPY
jgi:hypothetical protein